MKEEKAKKKHGKKRKRDADEIIIKMARKGAFAHIGEIAIAKAHALGHSATILIGNGIFELHPDGTRTLLKTI